MGKRNFEKVPKFDDNQFVNDIKGKEIGGMVSSLTMTPMQGISLVNPDMQQNLKR